jgi:hypothetical protein
MNIRNTVNTLVYNEACHAVFNAFWNEVDSSVYDAVSILVCNAVDAVDNEVRDAVFDAVFDAVYNATKVSPVRIKINHAVNNAVNTATEETL